jgi:hypothetical protein
MLQAVDLDWLQDSLEANDFVLVAIFADLWPGLDVRSASASYITPICGCGLTKELVI